MGYFEARNAEGFDAKKVVFETGLDGIFTLLVENELLEIGIQQQRIAYMVYKLSFTTLTSENI